MKRNIYRSFPLTLFTLAVSSTVSAQSFDHCNSVYETATRNLQIFETSYESLNTIYDEYCDIAGELRKTGSEAGLDIVVKQIPVSFTGTHSTVEQRMAQFCRNYSEMRYTAGATRVENNLVVVDALNAYNQCVEITNAGLTVDHQNPNGLRSILSFKFGTELTYKMQGVHAGSNLECSMQQPGTNELVSLSQESAYVIEENFTIFCDRIAIQDEESGRKYYPRTDVTFASNHGAYTVVYPAEEVEDIEFASMLDRRITGLENKLEAVQASLRSRTDDLDRKLTGQQEALVGEFNNFRQRLSVQSYLVYVGEHGGNGFGHFAHLGCGTDPAAWTRSQCGSEAVTMTHLGGRGGNRCGYNYFVMACVKK